MLSSIFYQVYCSYAGDVLRLTQPKLLSFEKQVTRRDRGRERKREREKLKENEREREENVNTKQLSHVTKCMINIPFVVSHASLMKNAQCELPGLGLE